jgi:hypothetical protein
MNKLLLTLQEVINDVAVLDGLKLSHHNCVCESSKSKIIFGLIGLKSQRRLPTKWIIGIARTLCTSTAVILLLPL